MTKRETRETRRKEILDAAFRCFSKRGYHDTKVDDIMKESNLSKGAIYWYFKGKRDIFISLIEDHLHEEELVWENLLDEHGIGPALLIESGYAFLRSHFENEKMESLFVEFVAESYRDQEIMKRLQKFFDGWIKKVKGVFKIAIQKGIIKDVDPEYLSVAVFALMKGLVEMRTMYSKKIDFEKVWHTVSHGLLEGIKKGGGQ
jgi:AcrR family transcriptional regulator